MTALSLVQLSNQIADLVERASASVVQVQGRRRPASGVVVQPDLVATTRRAIGQEPRLRIRTHEGGMHDAELRGWDPATGIALLQVSGATLSPVERTTDQVRTGQLLIGLARSWSNVITATSGIVAVIGGPLPTGPGHSIERVIRTTAPMHGGFAGGAVLDAAGHFAGLATAAAIRGLAVVIPDDIVARTVAHLAEHGTPRRGYLGIAGQTVTLADRQRDERRREGLLVVGISAGSPAEQAGLLVGDVIIRFDEHDVRSPLDVLELLRDDQIGRAVSVRVLRGDAVADATVTIAVRPQP